MLSVARQCELLSLPRSSYYYESSRDDSYNHELKRLIDEEYTRHPFFGYRRITHWLKNQGYSVNRKRVNRLMNELGLEAIYPKRRLSKAHPDHHVYPYLLRDVVISHPNQVWAADITYVRMCRGFVYLVALLDWYSRYVVSWELSSTLDHGFCVDALHQALITAKPEVFNTDQGCQFTCSEFTRCLNDSGVAISMDGRGRVFDNIFVERLWRTVKYEEVYIRDYTTPREARAGLTAYFDFYNNERPHQSLQYQTPAKVYHGE